MATFGSNKPPDKPRGWTLNSTQPAAYKTQAWITKRTEGITGGRSNNHRGNAGWFEEWQSRTPSKK